MKLRKAIKKQIRDLELQKATSQGEYNVHLRQQQSPDECRDAQRQMNTFDFAIGRLEAVLRDTKNS